MPTSFAQKICECMQSRNLKARDVSVAFKAATGVDLSEGKVSDLRRSRYLPTDVNDVEVLEVILEVHDGTLVSLWQIENDRRPKVGRPATGSVDEDQIRRAGVLLGAPDGRSASASQQFFNLSEVARLMGEILGNLPAMTRSEVEDRLIEKDLPQVAARFASVLDTLEDAQHGRVQLSSERYYEHLSQILKQLGSGDTVHAVSSATSRLWRTDDAQREYLQLNIEAVRGGATIQRLFVVAGDSPDDERVIAEQRSGGIEVRTLQPEAALRVRYLDDCVLFQHGGFECGYVGVTSVLAQGAISGWTMHLPGPSLTLLKRAFDTAWQLGDPR